MAQTRLAAFLGIGAGRAGARAPRAETEEEMRRRHARERADAGFARQTPADRAREKRGEEEADGDGPGDTPTDREHDRLGEDDAVGETPGDTEQDREDERRGERERAARRRAQAGDVMPDDDDVDPAVAPPELAGDEDLLDDDDEDAEAAEDEAIDREPDETARLAKRRRARHARRVKARRRERMRCAAIFQDVAASRNPALAAELAFNTTLPSARAIAILRRGGGSHLAARMGALGVAAPGPGASGGSARASAAASWDAILKPLSY